MIVGLPDAKAFNGDRNYYPFAFQKFGLETIKQIVRGEEYPYETLEFHGTIAARQLGVVSNASQGHPLWLRSVTRWF